MSTNAMTNRRTIGSASTTDDTERRRHSLTATQDPREGVILLVVLSMLAFLGILVISYVSFTGKSRQDSFGMATRQLRQSDPADVFSDAIATLIRGTSQPTSPLWGEDLLSDLYGVKGAIETSVRLPEEFNGNVDERPVHVGGGFVRLPLSYLQREDDLSLQLDPVDNIYSPGGNLATSIVPLFGKNTPRMENAADTNRQLFDPAWTPDERVVGLDDYLSGRALTFKNGPLAGTSFRIIRSVGWRNPNPGNASARAEARTRLSVYIELNADESVTLDNGTKTTVETLLSDAAPQAFGVSALFYARGADSRWGTADNFYDAGTGNDDLPYSFVINSQVLNGQGVGFDGSNVDQNISDSADGSFRNFVDLDVPYPDRNGQLPPGFGLPASFQPGFVNSTQNTGGVTKADLLGDFDETYDAADFQNWFLAQTVVTYDAAGNPQRKTIPSFHRPALINYLVNSFDYNNANVDELKAAVEAIRRATLRPLALSADLDVTGGNDVNPRFTGGNSNAALRRPLRVPRPGVFPEMRAFDLFVDALINGPWDVDNDGDGIPDSVWIDLGLPIITSPEGKLLRPLVAPMIEDLSARLNVNANGTLFGQAQLGSQLNEPWAGSTTVDQNADTFRGSGFGPAEITLPIAESGGTPLHNSAVVMTGNELESLLRVRYGGGTGNGMAAGGVDNDLLDGLVHGYRPPVRNHRSQGGLPVDLFGRGGTGLHRSGRVFSSVVGLSPDLTHLSPTPSAVINDNVNDPYEADPTGTLAGDNAFRPDELADWVDMAVFADRGQRSRLDQILGFSRNANPDIARMLTTVSTSFDVPNSVRPEGDRSARSSRFDRSAQPSDLMAMLADRFDTTGRLTDEAAFNAELRFLEKIVPRELRLGEKMDLNRPLGNGTDDNGNGTIDEPGEVLAETRAYPALANPSTEGVTQTQTSNYLALVAPNATNANPGGNTAINRPFAAANISDSRAVMARQLFALMMAVKGDGYEWDLTMPPNTHDQALYTARRVAQWAVNVVDFRDSDSIMTPFAYDTNPLNGWTVFFDTNGDGVADIDDEGNPAPAGTPPSPVVWGVEAPELVFTESMAFHDLRIRDTALEGGGTGDDKSDMPPDPHTDQVRIPQGSLFLELFSPRPRVIDADDPHVAGAPAELYSEATNGVDYYLDLDRTVTTAGANVPVWRIAISEPHNDGSPKSTSKFDEARAALPYTLSFEANEPLDELGADTRDLALERFVFFGQYTQPQLTAVVAQVNDIPTNESVFFNRNSVSPELYPEQYLTIAPREITRLGSQVHAASTPPLGPSEQLFRAQSTGSVVGLSHTNLLGNVSTANTTSLSQPGLSIIAAAFAEPLAWSEPNLKLSLGTGLPNGVGLNISEPLPTPGSYYAEPNFHYDSANINATTGFPLKDAYMDWDQAFTALNAPADEPADMRPGRPIEVLTQELSMGAPPDEPVSGGVLNYRTAFLQRLADPTLPYNELTNPYRTVDSIELDLEVFTGEELETTMDPSVTPGRHFKKSRERNGQTRTGAGSENALYSNVTNRPAAAPLDMTASDYFTFRIGAADPPEESSFSSTFNFLNFAFGDVLSPLNVDGDPTNDLTIVDASNPSNRGLPRTQGPFAVHEWLNREFASPYELLLVPACSQGRLFEEFSLNTSPGTSPYTEPRSPFSFLLNFFQSDSTEAQAGHFYRIFDYVTTKPRFRGEVDFVLPDRVQPFIAAGNTSSLSHSQKKLRDVLQVPYNTHWDGRRQGRINLNTLADYPVWMGLMFNHMPDSERASSATSAGTRYQEFLGLRRGYTVSGGTSQPITTLSSINAPPYNFDLASFDPSRPTQFGGVFRGMADGDLAPENAAPGQQRPGTAGDLRSVPVASGVLRPGLADSNDPLFTLDAPASSPTHRNRQRSAMLAHQTMTRMPNLVSGQSQTYMVRLTLGYFEVDPVNLGLGQEYNANIGKKKRFRATYVIDRSRPVGFAGPGTDINADDVIIYSRIDD